MSTSTPHPLTARIFRDSTPAPLWDGTIPKPWRVSDADALRQLLAELGYPSARAYVEHDGRALWVGIRDNRFPQVHSNVIGDLCVVLVAQGLRAHTVIANGRNVGIRVTDPGAVLR